jgi:tetratricopeptide (TPR) repeat protein
MKVEGLMVEAKPHLIMARHYLSMGRADKALETLGQPSAADFEDARFWLLRGLAFHQLERYEEAQKVVAKGLALAPESAELLWLLFRCEKEADRLAEAERAILKALQQSPENPFFLSEYALLVAQVGQMAKAERLLQEARRIDPHDKHVDRAAILVAYLRGDDSEAVQKGKALLAEEPEDFTTHYLLGGSLMAQGRFGDANRHAHTAAALQPIHGGVVQMARHSRFVNHWLMWPLRPLYRFGTVPVWIAAVVIVFSLQAAGFSRVSAIFAYVYLGYVIYSWTVPFLLRRWLQRQGRL